MRRIVAFADSRLRIKRCDLASMGIKPQQLFEHFRHDNPEFYKKRAMGLWTGQVPRHVSLVAQEGDWICMPRGAWRSLGRFLALHGVSVLVSNKTRSGTLELSRPLKFKAQFELGPDQIEAVGAMVRGRQGLLLAPCGAGKTTCAAAAIAEIGEKTLVLVHTDRILRQWVDTLRSTLGIKPGVFTGSEKKDAGPVVVGMLQSVVRRLQREPNWGNQFGAVILDEAHHAPASTFAAVLNAMPARWRIGLTATPKRRDGMSFFLGDLFGEAAGGGLEVLHEITDQDLDRHGRIIPVRVVLVPTSFQSGHLDLKQVGAYNGLLDDMERSDERWDTILRHVKHEIAGGHACLALAARRGMCATLSQALAEAGHECGLILGGGADRKASGAALEALDDGSLGMAAATTQMADEGLDIKRLDRGFCLTPSAANAGKLTQQFGRFKRMHENKTDAVYYYFWDRKHDSLRAHGRMVLAAVRPPHSVWLSTGMGSSVPLTPDVLRAAEKEGR